MKKFSIGFFAAVFLMAAVALFGLAKWGDQLKVSAATATSQPYQAQPVQPVQVWAETAVSQPAAQVEPQVMEVTPQPLVNMMAAPAASPTPEFPATPQFSPQFLADCALAQGQGRRTHPNCPTNAAEMLGGGR